MATQLTERDKKLLVLLAYFLIIVGIGWFVLKPLGDRISALDGEIEEAKFTQMELDQKLTLLDSTKQQLAEYDTKLAEEEKNFYPPMTSEEVDRMLTTIILSHSLAARDMIITENAGVDTAADSDTAGMTQMTPYSVSQRYAENGGQADTLSGLTITEVQILASGSRENLQSLLDSLFNDYPGIRVTAFGWSSEEADGLSLAVTMELFLRTQ